MSNKLPNLFVSSLAQTLNVGGNDTDILLSTIYTQDGQVIQTSDFADFGRGIITINPISLSSSEFASFAGITPGTAPAGKLTSVVRGLSFKDNTQILNNQKFNPVGTPVIISFGTHNIQDIMEVINNVVVNQSSLATTTVTGIARLSSSSDTTIGTATISIATPAVVTKNTHGLTAGDTVYFTTTGALPTGLTPGISYYVIAGGLGANVFELALTAGGTAINTSGTQSGVHTLVKNTPTALGINDVRIPTSAVLAALAGSQGTPSATNLFLTQDNVYNSDTDQTQTTQNSTVEFGMANTTGNKNKIQQSFIPVKTKTRGVKLYKTTDTGTFTGTVTVALYADSAGSPTGSALATVTLTNAQWLALPVGEFEADFSAEYSMTAGTLYWIQASASTADNSNHPNLGTNTAGGYANGSVKYWNTTDAYVAIANIDLYFKTLQGVSSQLFVEPTVPTIQKFEATFGGSDCVYTITNTSGSTYRYTATGAGTQLSNITATNTPIGTKLKINAQNFSAGNNGIFTVTGSGAGYFEVANASGVAEATKTLGTGYIANIYTRPAGVKYVEVELVDGGTGGTGSGAGTAGGASSFGTYVTSSVGDLLIAGQSGQSTIATGITGYIAGGSNPLGFGGISNASGTGYGSGGGGGINTNYLYAGGASGAYSRKLLSANSFPSNVLVTVGAIGKTTSGTTYGAVNGQAGVVIIKEFYY